jgi:phosphoribosylanthranilate isomerase
VRGDGCVPDRDATERVVSWVKICGITTEEDALLATAMGADAVGFVFAPSRRQITAQDARDIRRRLPPEIATIGVFKDESKERVVDYYARIGLAGVQIHGYAAPSDVRWIRERVPFLMRAYGAGDPALARAGDDPIDAVLVDSPSPGSGKVFDWTLAEGAPAGVRLVLAGGLNATNVADAIEKVRPWGVDVSTGVEASPGVKDERKLRRFVTAARAGFDRLEAGKRDRLHLDLNLAELEPSDFRPYDWSLDGE